MMKEFLSLAAFFALIVSGVFAMKYLFELLDYIFYGC